MIEKTLQSAIDSLPKIIFRKLLIRKLEEHKIDLPSDALDAFADHLLAGKSDNFIWDDGLDDSIHGFTLTFTEEDKLEIEDAINKALEAIPKAVRIALDKTSDILFNNIKRKWGGEQLAQQYELQVFKEDLEERWGNGLNYLRMLLTCCREVGSQTLKRHNKSKSKRHAMRRWVLVRLHARACQVADEIICLMENGFADGAMARWRTIHELSVVATIIANGDEDLAERYILHDAVEVKRQADEYEMTQVILGATPIGKRARKVIDQEYQAVLDRFGSTFAHPYGWAANHLNLKKPTFKDLQTRAEHAGMNSYYKLASFGVHASARSLFFNLSTAGDRELLLTGRSNAGLEDPGGRTAQSLTLITSLYAGSSTNLDQIAVLESVVRLRDAAEAALHRSANALLKEEKALKKIRTT
ncbi:DUF5677 domain-containing protein [Chitinibacter tainanensis]|uniref:DUF5677 domain-containing protein n=1 Tax=Chitinibacter tainanensis TaxID=230667 RepID=UPI0003FE9F19|nr:DUF5677 domain-containing protein [Chitinibacter tainanensis]